MTLTGAHVILYSSDAEADRAFLGDVLEFRSVDAGYGWLIFKLPPAEVAVHPADGPPQTELYLMCGDLKNTVEALAAKGVPCETIDRARWGMKTTIRLPGGGHLGLYQPSHPTALDL